MTFATLAFTAEPVHGFTAIRIAELSPRSAAELPPPLATGARPCCSLPPQALTSSAIAAASAVRTARVPVRLMARTSLRSARDGRPGGGRRRHRLGRRGGVLGQHPRLVALDEQVV